ncbi:MAG: NADP-dependent oxidoreductase [Woeseia sp.]
MNSTEVHLIARPTAGMKREHIDIVTVELRPLRSNEVLVENRFMSVDPYMLGRMQGSITYDTQFELGQVMVGEAVGEVIESRHQDFAVGDHVRHFLGWRDITLCKGDDVRPVRKIDGIGLDAHLDILSRTTGLAAYAGLFDIAKLQQNEAVFVTAGAGAVGATVCQMALALDCHVVATTGSNRKNEWLENEIGVSRAFNYRDYDSAQSFAEELKAAFPQGIDVMFENVGGMQLAAALTQMNDHGRIALCGMIEYYQQDYNNDWSVNTGPSTFIQIAERWLRVQGFSAPHYEERMDEFEDKVSQWIADGKIESRTTIVQGLENTVEAMNGIMTGKNIGKMVVQI